MLVLEQCTSLVQVHQSIAFHKNLVLLNLGGCTNLRSLPGNIRLFALSKVSSSLWLLKAQQTARESRKFGMPRGPSCRWNCCHTTSTLHYIAEETQNPFFLWMPTPIIEFITGAIYQLPKSISTSS
ncbi:hypothetical protein RJ639_023173 [Escallonia herrerae]|uniref:Uncharacterized protein n=1 Tax=Escallonia herrerae TaxID=1293975 RepID=A0AA88V0I4_9ASTE|nr:hypothetical protein RJ639_023173 [Escallonia herrerae]